LSYSRSDVRARSHCRESGGGRSIVVRSLSDNRKVTRRSVLLAAPWLLRGRAQEITTVHDINELNAAVAAALPGDTIWMANGTWAHADIRLEGQGTAQKPITLRAQTAGMVILTGSSRVRMAGRHLVVDGLLFRDGFGEPDVVSFRTSSTRLASHCRLTRCAIVDYSPADSSRDTKWVSLYGYRNRVDQCYFAGKTNLGATLVVWLPATGEPNHHWIERNHFGPRPLLGVNGAETIRVGDSNTSLQSSMTVVERNYFERCSGEIEIVSNKSCENVYRGNTFEECEGTLTLRHGNRCLVDGNTFIGNGRAQTGGVRIIGEDHRVVNNYMEGLSGTGNRASIALLNGIPDSPLNGYFQVKRALVAHNTTVQCARPLALGVRDESRTLAPEQCVAANNLFSGNRAPLVEVVDSRAGVEWVANLFHGAATGLDGVDSVEVRLERSEQGYWLPSAEGPARGAAGRRFAETAEDWLGRLREDPADVGCVELRNEAGLRGMIGKRDVGPDWLVR